MVFSCSTVAYLLSNAVIGHTSKRHGEGETGLVCTLVLGLTFLLLGPAPYVSSVPQRTIILCALMVFLGFSVGGITVLVETLMTKLVVCYYPRSWAINTCVALFRFLRRNVWLCSDAWCHCWPRFERSPRGRFNRQFGSAVHIEGSLQEGDREPLQFGPLYLPVSSF